MSNPESSAPVESLERRIATLEGLVGGLLNARQPPKPDPEWWRNLAVPPDEVEYQREVDEECRRIREADRRAAQP
jgi:hypothetical protein